MYTTAKAPNTDAKAIPRNCNVVNELCEMASGVSVGVGVAVDAEADDGVVVGGTVAEAHCIPTSSADIQEASWYC